jgi:Ca2+-binding EF-hand superfamily protein
MFHEEETEEGRVRKAFDKFDRDGSGHIDKTELGHLVAALDYPMEGEHLQQLIDWLDKNGDGVVDLGEFMDWWITSQVVHCTVLYCIVLYCIVLYCTDW